MAEQLALHEVLRESATVDRNKRHVPARFALLKQRARAASSLAGFAGLAQDHHRGIGRRHGGDQPVHGIHRGRIALTDQDRRPLSGLYPRFAAAMFLCCRSRFSGHLAQNAFDLGPICMAS